MTTAVDIAFDQTKSVYSPEELTEILQRLSTLKENTESAKSLEGIRAEIVEKALQHHKKIYDDCREIIRDHLILPSKGIKKRTLFDSDSAPTVLPKVLKDLTSVCMLDESGVETLVTQLKDISKELQAKNLKIEAERELKIRKQQLQLKTQVTGLLDLLITAHHNAKESARAGELIFPVIQVISGLMREHENLFFRETPHTGNALAQLMALHALNLEQHHSIAKEKAGSEDLIEQMRQMELEVVALKQKNNDLETQNSLSEAEAIEAKYALEHTRNQVATMQETLKEVEGELSVYRDELEHTKSEFSRLNATFASYRSEVSLWGSSRIGNGENSRLRRYTPNAMKEYNLMSARGWGEQRLQMLKAVRKFAHLQCLLRAKNSQFAMETKMRVKPNQTEDLPQAIRIIYQKLYCGELTPNQFSQDLCKLEFTADQQWNTKYLDQLKEEVSRSLSDFTALNEDPDDLWTKSRGKIIDLIGNQLSRGNGSPMNFNQQNDFEGIDWPNPHHSLILALSSPMASSQKSSEVAVQVEKLREKYKRIKLLQQGEDGISQKRQPLMTLNKRMPTPSRLRMQVLAPPKGGRASTEEKISRENISSLESN